MESKMGRLNDTCHVIWNVLNGVRINLRAFPDDSPDRAAGDFDRALDEVTKLTGDFRGSGKLISAGEYVRRLAAERDEALEQARIMRQERDEFERMYEDHRARAERLGSQIGLDPGLVAYRLECYQDRHPPHTIRDIEALEHDLENAGIDLGSANRRLSVWIQNG